MNYPDSILFYLQLYSIYFYSESIMEWPWPQVLHSDRVVSPLFPKSSPYTKGLWIGSRNRTTALLFHEKPNMSKRRARWNVITSIHRIWSAESMQVLGKQKTSIHSWRQDWFLQVAEKRKYIKKNFWRSRSWTWWAHEPRGTKLKCNERERQNVAGPIYFVLVDWCSSILGLKRKKDFQKLERSSWTKKHIRRNMVWILKQFASSSSSSSECGSLQK